MLLAHPQRPQPLTRTYSPFERLTPLYVLIPFREEKKESGYDIERALSLLSCAVWECGTQ